MAHNIKTRINNAGKLIIIIDPDADMVPAKNGKSDLLAMQPWLNLSDLDERLEGVKLQVIAAKGKSRRGRKAADDDDGDIDDEGEAAPKRGRGRASAKTEKAPAKRGRRAAKKAEPETEIVDVADLDEDQLIALFEDVTGKPAGQKSEARMVSMLEKAGVTQAQVSEDENGEMIIEAAPEEESEAEDEEEMNDDAEESEDADEDTEEEESEDEEVEEPGPKPRLGRRGKPSAKTEKAPAKRGRGRPAKTEGKERPADRVRNKRAGAKTTRTTRRTRRA